MSMDIHSDRTGGLVIVYVVENWKNIRNKRSGNPIEFGILGVVVMLKRFSPVVCVVSGNFFFRLDDSNCFVCFAHVVLG